jgi:signal transduction histidine kinase
LKKYQIEAIGKNFILFFLLQTLLLYIIYQKTINSKINKLDSEILSKMKISSYDLTSKEFKYDFVIKKNQEVVKLYKQNKLYSLFHIPTSNEYFLKISLNKNIYNKKVDIIKIKLLEEFLLYGLFIAILSFLFSLYSLYPLKKALQLNDEFIKDILHDFNTPISTLLINTKLLKKKFGENSITKRIEQNINNILFLQNNFNSYIQNDKLNFTEFNLKPLLNQIIQEYIKEYINLTFENKVENITINSNKDALNRILHNIISNSCKYNKKNGTVKIILINNILTIEDSGLGIKNPKKVFQRYYKENDRGIGIGLHIVKTLCDKLNIKINIFSQYQKQTKVMLDFTKIVSTPSELKGTVN